jgi:hypothetical protein
MAPFRIAKKTTDGPFGHCGLHSPALAVHERQGTITALRDDAPQETMKLTALLEIENEPITREMVDELAHSAMRCSPK